MESAEELGTVEQQIQQVVRDINKVQEHIEATTTERKLAKSSGDKDEQSFLEKQLESLQKQLESLQKDKQLRKKEEQLRKKEEQLRDEKKLLLQQRLNMTQGPQLPLPLTPIQPTSLFPLSGHAQCHASLQLCTVGLQSRLCCSCSSCV
jgi:serine phosphatase RsbU (regulator of sigma subunit)